VKTIIILGAFSLSASWYESVNVWASFWAII